eukprot:GHVP01048135.1.p1 GENE.GHVP01048135.1~~GHVP01048135.1.p1  ORF type:complete len:488 (+),score=53.42 GHVP01048135.1:757-2220(+)
MTSIRLNDLSEININSNENEPVHLGVTSVPESLTTTSYTEALRRQKLNRNDNLKTDGYYLWIKTMLNLQKIKKESEPKMIKYFGPTVLVTKPNKSIRVTHDYSQLKPMTTLYRFSQEKIEDIWTWASGRSFLIKLDCIKAFHSVEIDGKDQPFYGFVGPDMNNYHYTVLPMGCRNSPALFCEFVTKSLESITKKYPDCIRAYQDDIAISGEDKKQTMELATIVKDLLKLQGLITNEEKTYWNATEPKPLLGALWSPNCIRQQPEATVKLKALHDKWRQTRSLSDRQKFAGKLASLANFPGICSAIAANEASNGPEDTTIKLLQRLTITDTDTWKEEPEGILYVDASDGGVGAVLETLNGKVVKTYQAQNRLMLPIYELEWLALWKGCTKLRTAMKKFRMNKIRILSDNMVVVESFTKGISPKSPTSMYYLEKIREFLAKEKLKFTVEYVPTDENHADIYSRRTEGYNQTNWVRKRQALEASRIKFGI